MRLEIPVWQFVRVMVALEDADAKRGLYDEWRGAWQEVDRELERLRIEDPEGFAELMMEQQVVLEVADETMLGQVDTALGRVIADMDRVLKDKKTETPQRDDMAFERAELARLRETLATGQ